jgi:hypothetical protein
MFSNAAVPGTLLTHHHRQYFQKRTQKKRRLLHIGSLMASIDVVLASFPDTVFGKQHNLMVD